MPTPQKTAIVTGASRGIGAAIAQHLAANRYAVVVNYRADPHAAETIVAAITRAGGAAAACQADLTIEDQAKSLINFATTQFGPLDLLVNNAGRAIGAPLTDIDAEHMQTQTSLNIAGLLFATKHASAAFADRGGCIINISSVQGVTPIPGGAVYCATKAAVNAITISLAAELGPRNIRVNAIAPGLIMTDKMQAKLPEDAKPEIINATPLRRLGNPDDIADIVTFLASDAASWITGQIITASGGYR